MNADFRELHAAILSLKTEADCESFFADLCTPAERAAMAHRWKAARLLSQGLPYREIYEKTGISTVTVTRVARALTLGSGGYKLALERMKKDPQRRLSR